MTKDEIKNRISMALKDPILQQGFEIICKENAELKGEADSVLNNWCKGDDPCPHLKKRDEQLAKAAEDILAAGEFADLVFKMRTAQKKYYRTRSQGSLIESKTYEKEVDRLLEERQKRETERQNPGLF